MEWLGPGPLGGVGEVLRSSRIRFCFLLFSTRLRVQVEHLLADAVRVFIADNALYADAKDVQVGSASTL